MMKPAINPNVPIWECSPKRASGISSSTTTKIMAPAANAKAQGIIGVRTAAKDAEETENRFDGTACHSVQEGTPFG